jgi:hypothetical protein
MEITSSSLCPSLADGLVAGRLLVDLHFVMGSPLRCPPPPDPNFISGPLGEDMTKDFPHSRSLSSLSTVFTTLLPSHIVSKASLSSSAVEAAATTHVGVIPEPATIGCLECTNDSLSPVRDSAAYCCRGDLSLEDGTTNEVIVG